MARFLSSADIEKLTRGRVDKRMLQNWRLKGEWLTPTPKATSTLPYEHTFEHGAEAAIIAELDMIGMPQKLARGIIKRRLIDHAFDRGRRRSAVSEGDAGQAILSLPEFKAVKPCYWVIFVDSHQRGQLPFVIAVKPVSDKATLAEALAGAGMSARSAVVLDVSQIMQRIRLAMEEY